MWLCLCIYVYGINLCALSTTVYARSAVCCIHVCVWICLCVDATNVIRYGCRCRCRCVVVFISGGVVWCGAVSVRMQSIPFCERGNRNSVVVISTSSSSSFSTFSSVSSSFLNSEDFNGVFCSLFGEPQSSYSSSLQLAAPRILNDLKIVCCFSLCTCVGNVVSISGFFCLSSVGCVLILNEPYQALNTINDYIFFPIAFRRVLCVSVCVCMCVCLLLVFFAGLYSLHFSFNTDGKFMECVQKHLRTQSKVEKKRA